MNAVHQECWNAPVHTGFSLPAMAWKPRKRRGSAACRDKALQGETLYPLSVSGSRRGCKRDGLQPRSEACIPPQRRKESWQAASDGSWTSRCDPGYQPIRATHSRVGAMNERDTDVRRGSRMLQRRIASAGAAVQSAHLYGDGVSIVPNVCLEWVEPPEPSGSASGRRRGNTFESQTLRGRETVLEALKSTVRTGECCLHEQAISSGQFRKSLQQTQEILGWRAVYTERRKDGSERGTRHTRKGQRSLLYSKTGSACGRKGSAIW